MRSSLLVDLLVAAGLLAAGTSLSACQDPCVALAERICNCERTANDRQQCRADRITSQQSSIILTDDDRSRCTAALDTCTCNSLDENRLEECGFVNADGAAGTTP